MARIYTQDEIFQKFDDAISNGLIEQVLGKEYSAHLESHDDMGLEYDFNAALEKLLEKLAEVIYKAQLQKQ